MNAKIKIEELTPLLEFINSNYISLSDICNDLNKTIYLLHYLNADQVLERERHEVCLTLWNISESLHETKKLVDKREQ
jgi:hypothetical protein